jgi:hypothetical protein
MIPKLASDLHHTSGSIGAVSKGVLDEAKTVVFIASTVLFVNDTICYSVTILTTPRMTLFDVFFGSKP